MGKAQKVRYRRRDGQTDRKTDRQMDATSRLLGWTVPVAAEKHPIGYYDQHSTWWACGQDSLEKEILNLNG